jgi:acyl-CoA reductase-like NAD-dependent aldehyde dehydrogenase
MLHRIAGELRARHKEFATLMTLEGGKPYCENRDESSGSRRVFNTTLKSAATRAATPFRRRSPTRSTSPSRNPTALRSASFRGITRCC